MSANDIKIDHLAKLAALRLSEDEQPGVLADLRRIIAMVDAMGAVDVSGVEPLAHPLDATLAPRPDQVTEEVDRQRCQAGAPAVRDGLYIVPRAVE